MKVVVVASAGADLRPPLAERLKRIPVAGLHNARLQLRHPAGLYHISLERLAERFEAILDPLEVLSSEFQAGAEPPDLGDIIDKTEALLRSVMEYLEDCNNVLISLFPSNREAVVHPAVKQFAREIKPYRDRVAMIVNAVKHRAGRLRPAFMHWNSAFAPGYFVEGVLEGGIIGPDANIHNGGDTAISLFRDVKLHFVMIFFVSASLDKAVSQIVKLDPRQPGNVEKNEKGVLKYRELARRISPLPSIVFPDEIVVPFPLIRLLKADAFGSEVEFIYRVGDARCLTFGKFKLQVQWGGDGVADTFKVPYLRPGWQKDVLGNR